MATQNEARITMLLPFVSAGTAGEVAISPGASVHLGATEVTSYGTWVRVTGEGVDRPVAAGGRFDAAGVSMLVLDAAQVALRPTLAHYLGADLDDVDRALVAIADPSAALIIVGPRGSEHDRLARAIHDATGHGSLEMIAANATPAEVRARLDELRTHADLGAVYVDTASLRGCSMPALLAAVITDPKRRVRTFLAGRNTRSVHSALRHHGGNFGTLVIPPVGDRFREVPALLNSLLREMGSPHSTAELAPDRVEAMVAHGWRDNHEALRHTAERLHAYLSHERNLSAAARSLGRSPDSLTEALYRVGAID